MKKLCLSGLLITTATLLTNSAARADLTEKVTIRFSDAGSTGKYASGLKQATAAGLLPSLTSNTFYWSGDKIKTVTSGRGATLITITDLGSHVVTVLDPAAKVKYLSPDPFRTWTRTTGRDPNWTVIDTKQTTTILGHKARLFRFSVRGGNLTRTGYAWIAADVTAPPQAGSTNPVMVDAAGLSQAVSGMRGLDGTWLKASVVSVSSGFNAKDSVKASIVYEVTALSTDPIPASTFTVPQDYTTTDYTKLQAPVGRSVVPPPAH